MWEWQLTVPSVEVVQHLKRLKAVESSAKTRETSTYSGKGRPLFLPLHCRFTFLGEQIAHADENSVTTVIFSWKQSSKGYNFKIDFQNKDIQCKGHPPSLLQMTLCLFLASYFMPSKQLRENDSSLTCSEFVPISFSLGYLYG